ncbi:3'-5' exonuclease [Arthrospiribacter ruber]|uniref:3'-5' exonuclease n=2 Tax=Arthrospiribacter ruber TaxID=2487934 RepID=A0A951IZC4_9BACT|nr:3'-5' exonuclease [Arthrospiribacter ruber]
MRWWNFLFSGTQPKADFVTAYEEKNQEKTPGNRPISQLNFVVLDTETTGLNSEKDDLVSFGAVLIRNEKILVNSSREYFFTTNILNRESIKIHEIIEPKNPVSDEFFAEEFLKYIDKHIIVGHHIGFDLKVIERKLAPFGFKNFKNPILDTQYLATRLEKGYHYDLRTGKPGEYSLDSLCERHEVPIDDRHTAAGDAFLTAQLLLKLLKKAEKIGVKDFKSLMR